MTAGPPIHSYRNLTFIFAWTSVQKRVVQEKIIHYPLLTLAIKKEAAASAVSFNTIAIAL
jgi:hypothetical protein